MVDTLSRYIGGGPKHLSHREIEKMKKNMKRVPIIQLQSDIYHEKEMENAEEILGHIDEKSPDRMSEKMMQQSDNRPGFRKKILNRIKNLFISHS